MTDPKHFDGIDREQTAPVWSCGQLALALLGAAQQGSEEGVEVRPEAVGLPLALVQRFDEASSGDIDCPQRLLDACSGDGLLCVALQRLSVVGPGSSPGTFMMDWQTFFLFARTLLERTHDRPLGLVVGVSADGDWRKAALDMLEQASVAGGRNRGSLMLEQGVQSLRQQQDVPTSHGRTEPDAEYFRSLLQPYTFSCLRAAGSAEGDPDEVLGKWQTTLSKMKLAADWACHVEAASDEPYAGIGEAFESNQFAALTRRVMEEAARLSLDTDPIHDVFALFCSLFQAPFPFLDSDSAFNQTAWRSFCQAELARYADLEPRARAIAGKMMALLDAEARGRSEKSPQPRREDDDQRRYWTELHCPNCGMPGIEFVSQSEFERRSGEAGSRVNRKTAGARIQSGMYFADRAGKLPWCTKCKAKTPEGHGAGPWVDAPQEPQTRDEQERAAHILDVVCDTVALITGKQVSPETLDRDSGIGPPLGELVNEGVTAVLQAEKDRAQCLTDDEMKVKAENAIRKYRSEDMQSRVYRSQADPTGPPPQEEDED